MEKLLEVREFDLITENADYKEDEKYKYLQESAFHELIEFIHEFAGDEENSDVLEFMKIGYKRNVGEVVSIKNYVGLIQMKNGYISHFSASRMPSSLPKAEAARM